jgi:hypothetical protein
MFTLFDHQGDFEVLAIGLRSLLQLLPLAFREQRLMLFARVKAKWESSPREDQDEWLERLEKTRQALLTNAFKTESKLLEVIDALLEGPPRSDSVGTVATAGDLMANAHRMWTLFSDLKSPSDTSLAENAAQRVPVNTESFKNLLHSYRWTVAGFPVIKMSPKFAAAAMCTSLQPEAQENLRAPWRAFVLTLPKEPILYHYPIDKPVSVRHILVLWFDRPNKDGFNWTLWLMTHPEAPATIRYNITTSQLGAAHVETKEHVPWPEIENRDERALMLGGRIVSSAICALTNADMVAKVDLASHRRWERRPVPPRRADDLQPLVFQITAPVTIDLVDRVRDSQLKHSGNKGWKLNLRMVVGGHWKMQVCGPGRSGRKRMWIQPYERGPKNAPLAVRDHVINDDKDA